jgi:hypothetical protein
MLSMLRTCWRCCVESFLNAHARSVGSAQYSRGLLFLPNWFGVPPGASCPTKPPELSAKLHRMFGPVGPYSAL